MQGVANITTGRQLTPLNMYQETLESLGLSPNESKIYEALLEKGESTISQISVAAKVHRRNTYDAIRRLIDKGLVFEIFSTTENHYNSVDPDKLLELAAEREQKIKNILPGLKKKFVKTSAPEEVYIYRGLEGQKNIWRDIIRTGQDSFMVGAKGGWFDPKLETARKTFLADAKRKKIKFLQLFDYELKVQNSDFAKTWPGNLQYKYLPKEYSTNSIINIFGDYVITYTGLELFTIKESTVFFVLHNKDLAESYRKWFWYMWNQPTNKI